MGYKSLARQTKIKHQSASYLCVFTTMGQHLGIVKRTCCSHGSNSLMQHEMYTVCRCTCHQRPPLLYKIRMSLYKCNFQPPPQQAPRQNPNDYNDYGDYYME
jgi:hypothetical protein